MSVGGVFMKRHQTNRMTPLIRTHLLIHDSFPVVPETSLQSLASKQTHLEKVSEQCLRSPVWEEQLLRRSLIISAWISLILLRSAARLYSICSACVRGITCFSCTCANPNTALMNHNSNETWTKSKIFFTDLIQNLWLKLFWFSLTWCFLPFLLRYDGPQTWRKHDRPSTVCRWRDLHSSPKSRPETKTHVISRTSFSRSFYPKQFTNEEHCKQFIIKVNNICSICKEKIFPYNLTINILHFFVYFENIQNNICVIYHNI